MKYSILFICDSRDDVARMAVAFSLAAPGVALQTAHSSDQAREYLLGVGLYGDRGTYPLPQLVLLDLDLSSGGSGLDVLAWLKGEPCVSHIPVIIMTASPQSSSVDRAFALGAQSWLLKSPDSKVLSDAARGIGDYAALLTAKKTANREQSMAAVQPSPLAQP